MDNKSAHELELEGMSVQELREYAKQHNIRLLSSVKEKMISKILELEHTRATHGDAFRNSDSQKIETTQVKQAMDLFEFYGKISILHFDCENIFSDIGHEVDNIRNRLLEDSKTPLDDFSLISISSKLSVLTMNITQYKYMVDEMLKSNENTENKDS